MKICILGDTHIGMRNDSQVFHDLYARFYRETLIPTLEEQGVGTIIQLGDLFDRRKYINFNSLKQAREYLFDPLRNAGIRFYTLIGNHDIFYRNTLAVNSTSLLLRDYENVHIIDRPTTIRFGSTPDMELPIDLIPWVCEDNEKEIMEFIKNSRSPFCVGHFELVGFEMDRGNICHEGWDSSKLSSYELVLSGHFHHKSQKGNILYVGSPGEMTWADYDDPRGFHILDTETRELTFYRNPHTIFRKLYYNDDNLYFDEVQNMDFSEMTDKYVKVVVVKKSNSFLFETLMENLGKAAPIDITIVEDLSADAITDSDLDAIDEADDTMTIIDKVIETMEIDLPKPKLKSIMREVYTEALSLER